MLHSIYYEEKLVAGEPSSKEETWVYALPMSNVKVTDEEIGKMIRIKVEALSFLETAFTKLEKYHVEVLPEESSNPAV